MNWMNQKSDRDIIDLKEERKRIAREAKRRRQRRAIHRNMLQDVKGINAGKQATGYIVIAWNDVSWEVSCAYHTGYDPKMPRSMLPDYAKRALQNSMNRADYAPSGFDDWTDDDAG